MCDSTVVGCISSTEYTRVTNSCIPTLFSVVLIHCYLQDKMKIPKLRNEENLPSYDEATHFGFPRRLPPLSSITNNPTLQVDDIEFEDYGSLQKQPNQYPQMQKPLPSTGTTPLVHMRHPQP